MMVSIIITTYGRVNYVRECIESAMMQTYRNIEILLIDDNAKGSKENDYIKGLYTELASNDERIVYYETGHVGACEARNEGLKRARGAYVNFLDDDDMLLSDKIEKQLNVIANVSSKCIMVGGYEEYIDENNNCIGGRKNAVSGNVVYNNMCSMLCQTSVPLFKTKELFELGGFEYIESCQDHLLLMKVLDKYPLYEYVPQVVVQIRHYDGNRISTGKNKPIGAIHLIDYSRQYSKGMDIKSRMNIERALKKNVVFAFLEIGDKKGAREYVYKGRTHEFKDNVDTMKLYAYILLGYKNIKRIVKIKSGIKNNL